MNFVRETLKREKRHADHRTTVPLRQSNPLRHRDRMLQGCCGPPRGFSQAIQGHARRMQRGHGIHRALGRHRRHHAGRTM